jgi:hypothetical protein
MIIQKFKSENVLFLPISISPHIQNQKENKFVLLKDFSLAEQKNVFLIEF